MIIECMYLWACAYMHSHWIIIITGVWSKNVCMYVCVCLGVYVCVRVLVFMVEAHTEFGRRSESSTSLNFFFSVSSYANCYWCSHFMEQSGAHQVLCILVWAVSVCESVYIWVWVCLYMTSCCLILSPVFTFYSACLAVSETSLPTFTLI